MAVSSAYQREHPQPVGEKGEKPMSKKTEPDYEKAFLIMLEYWDSLQDKQKEETYTRLVECNVPLRGIYY